MPFIGRRDFALGTLLLLCFEPVACQPPSRDVGASRSEPPESDKARLHRLERQIEEEIGEPIAERGSECKTIAFGSKPCGGPWRYLVYSVAQADESRLERLVSEHNALEKKINEEEGRVSDCLFVTEPAVELQDGVCVIERS